ncbi:signal peptidase II [Bauldia sp.]|uniref:signal peptidase II n=1 Tax=Bauldia sp. TaxID=2575872 RepID=UPI003BAC781E
MTDLTPPSGPLSRLGLSVIAATILVDQASKAIAEAMLPFGVTIDVLPFLALHRVHNPGIAFSFLAGFGGWPLIVLTAVITVVVLILWAQSNEGGRWATVGYALIVGGALGNLIDRAIHGYVIDFLLLHTGTMTLFVFNLADTALTFGPAILVIIYLWPRRQSAGTS